MPLISQKVNGTKLKQNFVTFTCVQLLNNIDLRVGKILRLNPGTRMVYYVYNRRKVNSDILDWVTSPNKSVKIYWPIITWVACKPDPDIRKESVRKKKNHVTNIRCPRVSDEYISDMFFLGQFYLCLVYGFITSILKIKSDIKFDKVSGSLSSK